MPAIPPVPYTELPFGGLDPLRFEALWFYRAPKNQVQRVLPDGRTDVVVHVRSIDGERIDAMPRLAIAGPTDRLRDMRTDAGMVSIGLRMRPAWASTCLAVKAPTLRGRVLLASEAHGLLGPLASPLAAARSVAELLDAMRALADQLAQRAPDGPGPQRAERAVCLLEDGPGMPPADVAEALGVPERTLRRDVLAAVGLPMRSLSGLARFRRALALMRAGHPSLSEIAFCAGYSDQAHMNREFRRYGGFTPARPAAVPLIGTGQRATPAARPKRSRQTRTQGAK